MEKKSDPLRILQMATVWQCKQEYSHIQKKKNSVPESRKCKISWNIEIRKNYTIEVARQIYWLLSQKTNQVPPERSCLLFPLF